MDKKMLSHILRKHQLEMEEEKKDPINGKNKNNTEAKVDNG